MSDLTIRLQTLGGYWETAGVDRFPEVKPESLTYVFNEWMADTCSFTLKRRSGDYSPDLTSFTPCEIEIGGVLCWSGRVKETPTKSGSAEEISVQGEGWQYHLDDDVYESAYVHTRLNEYKDMRSSPGGVLTGQLVAAGQVSNDNGIVMLAFPTGTVIGGGNIVAVTLDLGPGSTGKRCVIEWEASNTAANAASINFYARASDGPDNSIWAGGTISDAFSFALNTGASGTTAGTFGTARRYINLFLYATGGFTATADMYIKIKSAQVFSNTAYESGNSSTLKAYQPAQDAISRATTLLSANQDVTASDFAFSIPDFMVPEPKTPREVIGAVNTYHDYLTQVDVNSRFIFKPKPVAPVLQVGTWAGSNFEDASANSGEDIYNRAYVTGTAPDSSILRVTRTSGQQPGAELMSITTPSINNPSFDVNTTGWTAGTRDTTLFDTSPASLQFTITVTNLIGSVTGTFNAGVQYVLAFKVRTSGTAAAPSTVTFGSPTDYATATWAPPYAAFTEILVPWTPATTTSSVSITFPLVGVPAGAQVNFDTFKLWSAIPTVVDRRNFRRTKILPISGPMTVAAMTQIGDIFLAGHKTTPLKGTVNQTAPEGVRKLLTGESVPPEQMGLYSGQLVNLSHIIDPDTGALGRDGRIAGVTYTHADRTAKVDLDNRRGNFEAFIERLAIVTGTALQS